LVQHKLMTRQLIIPAFFLFLNGPVYSQTAWRIDKLGVTEGLSQGYVYAIHQDKKGFMWIGTHCGLNRYDGYGFRSFEHQPFNATSLGDNSVYFVIEDSTTGHFWIGGSTSLNEFDPETFFNKRYQYTQKQVEYSDGLFISKNELLLACEYTVLLFNIQTRLFLEIPIYNEDHQAVLPGRIENICTDKNGNFMVMSRTGVFIYDAPSKTCKRKAVNSPDFFFLNTYELFNIIQDSNGFYWIATNKKGLIRYQPASGEMLSVQLPRGLQMENIRFDVLKESTDGYIWAGSSQGLFRINPLKLITEYFSAAKNEDGFLSHPEINVITEDKNHFMWIGTVGGGINKLVPKNPGFKNFALSKNNKGSIKAGTYTMAIQQLDHHIWFANIWDQVGKVNIQTGHASLLSKTEMPPGFSWYSEGAIVKRKGNSISILNGEGEYNITHNTTGKVLVHAQNAPGLSYIFTSTGGKIWYMVKKETDKIYQQQDTIYGNNFFYDATEDAQGNIWIGSSKGLIKFEVTKNKFTQYQHNDNDHRSISSDQIYAMEIDDKRHSIWMAAYNGGLCSFNILSGKFRHYSKEDGLTDNIVYAIEQDHHGNFWFSSNSGISVYNTSSGTFRTYGIADGLLNYEFNRRSSCKNDEGWIFFGGIFGIDYFHPDSIIKINTEANLTFTGFKIFNYDYIPSKKTGEPVIELKHTNRYISIEFASLDYNDQRKIQYAYRINDTEWITTGNRHSLSFSNLATGNHRLHIRSTNSEGLWLNNEISCLITVHPAWWQTWWFRIVTAFLLIGLSVTGFRFYYRRKLEKQRVILEKQQAVEKERTRIATDMHDDLGAGLSRIKFLSETIGIKQQQQQPIQEDIGKIRQYSHEMIDKMGEIVWALNEKNDSLSDLLSYTRAYAVEYLSQNGIFCQVDMPEQILAGFVSGEFRRNIYLTVKEALHNIVKHAAASTVSIKINTDTILGIKITDNGIGFDRNHIPSFGNGLSNMEKRIKEIGGSFKITGVKGTEVQLFVPLPT
jgi:signal transduction histidine kinase/ligand-binding sensor domain-containing protein